MLFVASAQTSIARSAAVEHRTMSSFLELDPALRGLSAYGRQHGPECVLKVHMHLVGMLSDLPRTGPTCARSILVCGAREKMVCGTQLPDCKHFSVHASLSVRPLDAFLCCVLSPVGPFFPRCPWVHVMLCCFFRRLWGVTRDGMFSRRLSVRLRVAAVSGILALSELFRLHARAAPPTCFDASILL